MSIETDTKLFNTLRGEAKERRGLSGTCPSDCSCSVTVRRGYDGWGVQFNSGVRHFDVGPQDFETEREAEWMATMFRNALADMDEERNAVRGSRNADPQR